MRFFTKKSCYYQGFFAVKRRAVFILGAMWIALVRGWQSDCVVGGMETRFPMTQSAQSHRQMRSIPRCPKAVFYVFVFDSIHNSATLLNPSPSKFPTEPKKKQPGLLPRLLGKIILMLDYCSLASAAAMRVVASTMFSSLVA